MRFQGKKVLVTGGARGIGEAAALAFLQEGATVAVGSRARESYDNFIARHPNVIAHAAVGDISSQHGAASVVGRAVEKLEGLDILVNSAGYFVEMKVEDIDQAHWDQTMNTNVAGTFFASQAALPALKVSGGNIVNIASDAGIVGYPNGAAYSAAKAAVINLSRAMVLELAKFVRINCVCPGNVDTDMIQSAAAASSNAIAYLKAARARSPMQRMALPEEVAAAVLYLASSDAGFVNGAILSIDGGGVCGF